MNASEPLSPSVRHARHVVAAVFLGLLVLLLLFAAFVFARFGGPEMILFTLFIWPLGVIFGLGHALVSPGRLPPRVLVVLAGLATPFLASELRDFAVAAGSSFRRGNVPPEVRAELSLRKYMETPRRVIFVSFPYVVVEGGYSLLLDYVEVRPENTDAVRDYLETEILGHSIRAELSSESLHQYLAGARNPVTAPYAQGPSATYGDVPATITIDGVIVNFEIDRRWGYDDGS